MLTFWSFNFFIGLAPETDEIRLHFRMTAIVPVSLSSLRSCCSWWDLIGSYCIALHHLNQNTFQLLSMKYFFLFCNYFSPRHLIGAGLVVVAKWVVETTFFNVCANCPYLSFELLVLLLNWLPTLIGETDPRLFPAWLKTPILI